MPRAQLFQERTDRLQQWLTSVDQDLADLRSAERGMLHLQEATGQAKVSKTLQNILFFMNKLAYYAMSM